jgi:hypothetical protein
LENTSSRKQVRLEYGNQPARTHYRSGRAQCRSDLGGVVGVVVVNPYPAAFPLQFEAALGAGEVRNSLCRILKIKPTPNQDRNRTSGIERIVMAWNLQLNLNALRAKAEFK